MERTKAAWLLAIVADALQFLFLPAFVEGFLSPLTDVLDVVVAIGLTILLGWHWAFLPTALAELIPAFNVFPTWTAAVFFVTQTRRRRETVGSAPSTPSPIEVPETEARRKELPPGAP